MRHQRWQHPQLHPQQQQARQEQQEQEGSPQMQQRPLHTLRQ
jgi:hypothetical protein